jgi:predicted amidohydrolase
MKMKVACVQMRSGVDEARNADDMAKAVREAASRGAQYIQTPEVTGLVQRDRAKFAAALRGDTDSLVFREAARLAGELGILLHVGSTPIAAGNGKAFNRAALFGPDGRRMAGYDKIHMFDVDLAGESWRESATIEAGDTAVVVETGFGRIGLGICYDLRFAALFRAQAHAGAAILTAPACFTRQTGEAHWHVLARARAIENGAYLIAAAQGGRHEDGRESFGHSLVVDPWGRIIGELDHDEPGLLTCEIDLSAVDAARQRIPSLRNEKKFSLTIKGAAGDSTAARGRNVA